MSRLQHFCSQIRFDGTAPLPDDPARSDWESLLDQARCEVGDLQAEEAAIAAVSASTEGLDSGLIEAVDSSLVDVGFIKTVQTFQHSIENVLLQDPPAIFDSFPEIDRLRSLHSLGASILTTPDFTPNDLVGGLPRAKYRRLAKPIHALLGRAQRRGLILLCSVDILRRALASDRLRGHASPIHWTSKPTNPLGRQLVDYSASDVNSHALNSPDLQAPLERQYGPLHLPTLSDFMAILQRVSRSFPGDILISKIDISDAFHRVRLNPADSRLMCCRLLNDIAGIYLVGNFGYSGLPAIYGVITRALQHAHNKWCQERFGITLSLTYVDDMVIFSPAHAGDAPVTAAIEQANALLSSCGDAIQHSKLVLLKHTCDIIGWSISTIHWQISPSSKAIRKLVYVFFVVTPADPVRLTVRAIQRLQGLTCRYSEGIPLLKPFSHSFVNALRNLSNPARKEQLRRVSTTMKQDVWVWRCILQILVLAPQRLSCPVQWLTDRMQTLTTPYVVYVDASTSCKTVAVYAPHWGYYVAWQWPEHWPELPHINVLEFLATTLGALLMLALAPDRASIVVYSDSTTALSWAHKCRASSPLCFILLLTAVMLQVRRRSFISYTHVPGVQNVIADALSRNRTTERLLQSTNSRLHIPQRLLELIYEAATESKNLSVEVCRWLHKALTALDNISSEVSWRVNPATPNPKH